VTHVATAPYECQGNLIFCDHGLIPCWAIGHLLTQGYDGHGEVEIGVSARLTRRTSVLAGRWVGFDTYKSRENSRYIQ